MRSKRRARGLWPVVLALLVPGLAAPAGAQESQLEVGLISRNVEIDRLAPGTPNGEAGFSLGPSGTIIVQITASLATLETEVETPGGQIITSMNAGTFGGTFAAFEGSGQDSPFILGPSSPGFHYIFAIPSQGPGDYTVRFAATTVLAEDVAVITQVLTDSQVSAALMATEPLLILGNTAVLVAPVFDGGSPVAGATVDVTVLPDGGAPLNLSLADDGIDPDDTPGDGLYSGQFVPAATGGYGAVAEIDGLSGGGIPFHLQAATELEVVSPGGSLTGAVTDRGVDDDLNGLLDRVVVGVGMDAFAAGSYGVFVHLSTALGQTLVRSGRATLGSGVHDVDVSFEAEALRALNEDGPYFIQKVELVLFGPGGAQPADILLDAGQTQAYMLGDLERPPLSLTGNLSATGVDDDGNGRFDRLVVGIEVDVRDAAFYSWSLKLTDQARNEIEFASGSGFLNAGPAIIQVDFDGLAIGDSRQDGPYLLRDLLMFGGGASLVVAQAGTTPAYLASQFESSNLPPAADAGPDQLIPCLAPGPYIVTLDGSGSSDPEGDPLGYTWTGPFPEGGGQVTGVSPTVSLPVGISTIQLIVNDGSLDSPPDEVVINIEDSQPPQINATLRPVPAAGEEGPDGDWSCWDESDNDGDGLVDDLDPDCHEQAVREGEPGDPACQDEVDNDQDGRMDSNDPDCHEPQIDPEIDLYRVRVGARDRCDGSSHAQANITLPCGSVPISSGVVVSFEEDAALCLWQMSAGRLELRAPSFVLDAWAVDEVGNRVDVQVSPDPSGGRNPRSRGHLGGASRRRRMEQKESSLREERR